MKHSWLIALCSASLLLPACATDQGDAEDGEHDAATGKADSPAEGSADARAILSLVNDSGVSEADLDHEIGLSNRVAVAIVGHRDGADRTSGTADDDPFDTLAELDAIPYLGPTAMEALLTYARRTGTTTLTIKVVATEWQDGTERTVALDSLNGQLAAHGISFPKTITLGARDGARFNKILADLEIANEKLGRELELDHGWDPSEYEGLCYTGAITGIPQTVEGLRESMFSIYMGIQGERWGTKKVVHQEYSEAEWLDMQREENPEQVQAWEEFDTSSDAYLMMTDGGQQGDGTEFFAVLIPPCA